MGPMLGSVVDYRSVFESVPGLFLLIRPDAAWTIAGASDEYLRVTRTEREEIVGRPLFEVFPDDPDDPAADGVTRLRASLVRVVATRAADVMAVQKYAMRDPDTGGFVARHWSPVNAPVLGPGGEVELIIQRVEDVTELVHLRGLEGSQRAALMEVHDRLEAAGAAEFRAIEILESITEGFFTLDRTWRFEYVNGAALRILDSTRDELAGNVLWEVYPGLEGTSFEWGYKQAMYTRQTASFTEYYPQRRCWYEVTTYPAPRGISVYFRDVTAQKQVEAERERLAAESARQQRIYEAALSNTPDLVYIFGLDHRFIYANEALLRMWGMAREEALTKSWQELGYEAWHSDMHDREIDQVIATRQAVRGEVPFHGTEGRRIYDYIFTPVFGPTAPWWRSRARPATSRSVSRPSRRSASKPRACWPPTGPRTSFWRRSRTS